MDHNEFCCIFDTTQYTGTPDTGRCPQAVDVPLVVQSFDNLCAAGREAEALALLEQSRDSARQAGDWRGELSMTNELLGQYLRMQRREAGLAAVNDALELIRAHHLGRTVSGATILLNAATTLRAFGHAAESVPIFTHVGRVYADNLDPADYRFAGLYDNMALSYAETGDLESAERFFMLALKIIAAAEHPENDSAVTWCSLAEMYGKRDPEDVRVEQCLEKAWTCLSAPDLPRDGRHAFAVSRCAPIFEYYGFFLYAKELRERAETIYAGT